MDVKSLKGIAVVSIADGEKVGTIEEMLFDTEQRRLTVFQFARSHFFRGSRDLVKMADVQSIGPDAVMIPSRDSIRGERDLSSLGSLTDLGTLTSLRVVTQNGAYVGNLVTVQFDKNTGAITVFEVSGGGITSVLRRNLEIPASEVFSIGSDVIVIPNSYGPEEDRDEKPAERTEARNDSEALPLPESTRE